MKTNRTQLSKSIDSVCVKHKGTHTVKKKDRDFPNPSGESIERFKSVETRRASI